MCQTWCDRPKASSRTRGMARTQDRARCDQRRAFHVNDGVGGPQIYTRSSLGVVKTFAFTPIPLTTIHCPVS